MDAPASDANAVLSSAGDVVSQSAFNGIAWGGFALCTLALSGRLYIRFAVFRKLFFEDFFMILAWALMGACAAICQVYIENIYLIEAVGNGTAIPPPTFLTDFVQGLHAVLINNILTFTGIFLIKFNFLFFFKRIGSHVTAYLVIWWIFTLITLGVYAVELGILSYECTVSDLETLTGYCTSTAAIRKEYTVTIISVVLDAGTDLLILCFPFIILWRVRLPRRKLAILLALFSLNGFILAVTIVRGSIFGGVYKSFDKALEDRQSQSITWVWFWLTVEFIVEATDQLVPPLAGFIVACATSFRSLFSQSDKKTLRASQAANRRAHSDTYKNSGSDESDGKQSKKRQFYDSLLDTFESLEGSTRVDYELSEELAPIHSGGLGLDFMQGDHWVRNA
ncbi:hypothetical protein NPX13_g8440 [Xylaria arbuscula]|uniref:Rhodopsin domain-containing protein n=1 Tax=Xylaria arbuscula TaxID=114810 RepID=A0A9W8N8Q7_9PEZI|nr:hypothetical protein NPX13_g8440 [Xylaria arbuscula]